MSRSFVLAAILALGSAVPALAQETCTAPIPPTAIDGATATPDQMRGAHQDVNQFIKESDVYQECLGKEIDDAKAKAAADKKPVDQSLIQVAMTKASDNQKMKEKVGGEFNAAVGVYKKAHPNP